MFRFDGIEFIHELFAGTRAHLRRVCLRVRLHSARGMIGNDGWCAEQTETECSACACARFGWITVKYLNVLTHTHTHAHARRTHSAHTHMSIFFMAIGGVVSDRKVHTAHHRTVAQSTQFVLGCFVFFFFIANGSFSECHAMVGGAGSQSVVRRVNSFENNCVRNVRACVR